MSTVPNRWDSARAARMSELERLAYRVSLLGAGTSSAKLVVEDPLDGGLVRVLYVAGAAGDPDALELDKLLALEDRFRGRAHEDELAPLVERCAFARGAQPPSLDAALHAFVPWSHLSHVHADAALALACVADGERLVREAFGREVGWLGWLRPGFELALRARELAEKAPEQIGLVLGGRGLLVFGESSEGCYRNALEVVNRAQAWLEPRLSDARAFGAVAHPALAEPDRHARAAALLPVLRGKLSTRHRVVARFDDSPEALAFVASERLEELTLRGAPCPDPLRRPAGRPLVLAPGAELDGALARYRAEHEAWYARCKRADSPPPRDADPRVVLAPGIGLFAFGPDATSARDTAEGQRAAIAALRGAESVDRYAGLSEQDAFDVEFWPLVEARRRRLPAPAPLAGRVAYVTGGAGELGRAIVARLQADGAQVVEPDLEPTDEASVAASFQRAVLAFGGVDIVVWHGPPTPATPLAETSLALWRRTLDALATAPFLVAREAFRVLASQGLGGSIALVGGGEAAAVLARRFGREGELHDLRVVAVSGEGEDDPEAVAETIAFLAARRFRARSADA